MHEKIKFWPVRPIINHMSDPHLYPGAGQPCLGTGSHYYKEWVRQQTNRTDDEKK